MNSKKQQLLAEKASQIYKQNKTSSLFVRQAELEMKKNTRTAIEILQTGLKLYPHYPVAYLLLGKAFAKAGDFEKAFAAIQRGSKMIFSKATYDEYVKEIEQIRKQSYSTATFEKPPYDSGEKADIFGDNDATGIEPDEDGLIALAKKISMGDTTPSLPDPEPVYNETDQSREKGKVIASETLANIYVAQGEVSEAIKIYQTLIKQHPEKKHHFESKIADLRSNEELY